MHFILTELTLFLGLLATIGNPGKAYVFPPKKALLNLLKLSVLVHDKARVPRKTATSARKPNYDVVEAEAASALQRFAKMPRLERAR